MLSTVSPNRYLVKFGRGGAQKKRALKRFAVISLGNNHRQRHSRLMQQQSQEQYVITLDKKTLPNLQSQKGEVVLLNMNTEDPACRYSRRLPANSNYLLGTFLCHRMERGSGQVATNEEKGVLQNPCQGGDRAMERKGEIKTKNCLNLVTNYYTG